ncbi:MAG TPA: hypothetical protein VHX59_06835 [Mycobacteriales bacterium]|nr:hypothetical protein [Mycobacteriales bacterium]
MIVVSLLLVLGSAVMLVLGLAEAHQVLIWASIGASIAAALSLATAVVRRRGESGSPLTAALQGHGALAVGQKSGLIDAPRPPSDRATGDDGASSGRHSDGGPGTTDGHSDTEPAGHHPDPPDEPPEEDVSASDVLRIVDLLDEVLVVDGRPRYHLAGCRHLVARETIPLPVSEAREAQFTPCAWCHPDSTIADRARGSLGDG